jgi:hypothetical protein
MDRTSSLEEELKVDSPKEDQNEVNAGIRRFLQACEDNDGTKALRLAKRKKIPRAYLRHGLEQLLISHQNYEGSAPLLKESGIVNANGGVDTEFTHRVLSRSRDPMGAVLFLNSLRTKYDLQNFSQALSAGEDVCQQMIQSGNFDVKQDNSRSLLYAVAMGNKTVFHDLLKKGADAQAAISGGSDDPRWEGNYARLAEWAGEFYRGHPEMAPNNTTRSETVANQKERGLVPPKP